MTMHELRTAAVCLTLAAACAVPVAHAAKPQDVARARNVSKMSECTHCDLTNAKMAGGFFQLANMVAADLSGANFDGANLAGAQLDDAKAVNASFVYTNFSGTKLTGADMRGANFANAWLNWTWFAGAKLDGANFEAVGLTQDQLEHACGDASTMLPPGLRVPACVVF